MKSLDVVFQDKLVVDVQTRDVEPLASNQIRCRARKSLISTGTETTLLKGISDPGTNWSTYIFFPRYPGYSMSAEVVEVGSDVQDIQVGDNVFVGTRHSQYFNVNASNAYLLPEGVSHEQASWLAISRVTQVGVRRAELKLGESVGVIGLGILGQLVVQYLRAFGARRIVAIDTSEVRLEAAKRGGATHTLLVDAAGAYDEVKRLTGGTMLDAVFDVTGHPAVLAPATLLVREMGRVVLLGDTSTPSQQHLGPRVLADSVAILGIHGRMSNNYNGVSRKEMSDLFFDYLLQNRMNVDHLTTHRYSPLDAKKAYEMLMTNRSTALGVIFDWDQL